MPKSVQCKISQERLQKIIAEEIESKLKTEAVDQVDPDEAALKIHTASHKLLKALKVFKEDDKLSGAVLSAVTPHLDSLINTLQEITNNPKNYTDQIKVEPKRVKLRRVEETKTLKSMFEAKKTALTERTRYKWKPEYIAFMDDLRKKGGTKHVPVSKSGSESKIADDLNDLNMLKVVDQQKLPRGLVRVYQATDEGKEEFYTEGN